MSRFSSGSRFSFGPSILQAPRSSGASVSRASIRPEYDKFLQEQRGLQLDSQREVLRSQRQKTRLLEQLLGGGGIGAISQPGGPDADGIPGLGAGHSALLERTLGDISRLGGAQRQRIEQGSQSALNSALARLSDRGLSSSSLTANVAQGAEQRKQTSLTELEDALLGRQIGATQQIGLSGLESQQALLMQLLQSLLGGG